MDTDRIVKKIVLRAPRARVWRAITDSKEFGYWFGVKFNGPFVANTPLHGVISPSQVDAEMAKAQKPHAGKAFEIVVAKIEPERHFSFRWHPDSVDPGADLAAEPSTLVEFLLEEVSDGTMLTLTESGFDQIPLDRRAKAFAGNEQGWSMQMHAIEKYLAHAA
ncbi:MAG TPA: SRPBCC family protein [Bryobacteraceae bacterium]|nr:SRPBCC family protein [Bryobacteraceae bacterium]